MRIIILVCFCFLQSTVWAQDRPLAVCEIQVNASLVFYDIESMIYYRSGKWNELSTTTYNQENAIITFHTGEMFSLLDGGYSSQSLDNQSLKEHFDLSFRKKRVVTRSKRGCYAVMLKEKDWASQKKHLGNIIREQLEGVFSVYNLAIEMDEVQKEHEMWLTIKVRSNTGGDEFETTESQRQRVAKMKADVLPALRLLVEKHHAQRLRKLQQTKIEPYRDTIRANNDPQKLHTITIDVQELGTYSADKEQFYNVKCSAGWRLERLDVSLEQAKVLRANPEEYQMRAHVFQGRMSHPWGPNQDLSAFGFYEIVHKETQRLLVRTSAYFDQPSTQSYHRRTIVFPQF